MIYLLLLAILVAACVVLYMVWDMRERVRSSEYMDGRLLDLTMRVSKRVSDLDSKTYTNTYQLALKQKELSERVQSIINTLDEYNIPVIEEE